MRTCVPLLCLFLAVSAGNAALSQPKAETGLVPPPAIYVPYGGQVVTEVNLSDGDVLGIIKQVIPAIGQVAASMAGMSGSGMPVYNKTQAMSHMAGMIDFAGLSEAIAGIRNVRVIIANYPRPVDPKTMLAELDAGAAKAGRFSKIVSDIAFGPGAFALYAQPNNEGYMGFVYDSKGHVLYAARIVGFADVTKLTQWVANIAKMFGTMRSSKPPVVMDNQPGETPDGQDKPLENEAPTESPSQQPTEPPADAPVTQ